MADLALTEELDVELDDVMDHELARRSEELEADLDEEHEADEEF